MFVSTLHLYYLRQIEDPLFPANNATYIEGDSLPYFTDQDPRARAVACIDQRTFCDRDNATCWLEGDDIDNLIPDPDYKLMKWALDYSTMYDSMSLRLQSALLAQQMVSQYLPRNLERNHWMYEMSNLFATSLARSQFDALAIASGEGFDRPGYTRQYPEPWDITDVCSLVKFRSKDSVNILLFRFLVLLIEPIVSFFLSLDVRDLKLISRRRPTSEAEGVLQDSESALSSTEQRTIDESTGVGQLTVEDSVPLVNRQGTGLSQVASRDEQSVDVHQTSASAPSSTSQSDEDNESTTEKHLIDRVDDTIVLIWLIVKSWRGIKRLYHVAVSSLGSGWKNTGSPVEMPSE
jgi:hypothetical protein